MSDPKAAPGGRWAAIPAAVLAAAALAMQFAAPNTMRSEGVPTDGKGNAVAYVDRLGRRQPITICFGQTGFVRSPSGELVQVKLGMKFPLSHCRKILEESELGYTIPIWRVTPGIAAFPHSWAAAIDFVHNFNIGVYARSSIAREFNAGHWLAGCDRFLPYNKGTVRGRLVVLPGLADRRRRNRLECRIDHLPPAEAAAAAAELKKELGQ
jgi:lysozyme